MIRTNRLFTSILYSAAQESPTWRKVLEYYTFTGRNEALTILQSPNLAPHIPKWYDRNITSTAILVLSMNGVSYSRNPTNNQLWITFHEVPEDVMERFREIMKSTD